jgi:small conductance mechanosensitive channel
LEKVRALTIEQSMTVMENTEAELFFNEFGSSSINFTLRFWINDYRQKAYLKAQSDAIIAIKKAFDENDIMIPFPIRTLDFRIKGGEKRSEVLPKSLLTSINQSPSRGAASPQNS